MASIDNEQIIIDFETNASVTVSDMAKVKGQIDELKKAQKELQDIKKQNGSLTEAEAEQYEQLGLQIKTLGNTYRQLQTEGVGAMTALKDSGEAYSDSIAGMRAQLSDLTKIYDNLSEAQRQSSQGLELQANINDLTSQLKILEEETGRFQRNVGNYPEQITAIIPGISQLDGALGKLGLSFSGLATSGVKAFSQIGNSFTTLGKAFLSNPVGIVLTGLVLVVTKLVDAFKKNDDAMTELQKAFTVFSPILEAINFLFDKLAEGIAFVIGGMANLGKSVLSLIPGYEKSQKAAEGLVQAQDDLEESEREYTVNSARRNKEIARLRDEAVENPDVTKRMEALKEAQRLEEENLKEELKIAQERVRIREAQAKKDKDTSDETKNEIAKMRADMLKAEQTYYEGHRKLQKEYNRYQKEAISGLSKERQEIYKNIDAQLQEAKAKKTNLEATMKIYAATTHDTSSAIYKIMEKGLSNLNAEIDPLQKKIDAMLKESENAQKKSKTITSNSNKEREELAKNLEKLNEELLDDHKRVLAQLKKDYEADQKIYDAALDQKLISQENFQNKSKALKDKYDEAVTKQNQKVSDEISQNRMSNRESQINEKYDNGESIEKQLLDLEYDDYADYQLRKQQLVEETNQKILDNEIAKSQAMIALWQQELSDWEGTEEEKANLQAKIDAEQEKLDKNLVKKQEATMEAQNNVIQKNEKKKEKNREQANKALSQSLSTASALAGDNAEAQKGIQVSEAIINTISGAVGTFQGIMKDTDGWGLPYATVMTALVTAAGMANVKEIIDTKIPGGDGSGSAASTAPSINASSVASLTDSTQAVNTVIGDETIQAMSDQRVYVVESDITSTQKKVEVAENGNNF